MTYDRRGTRRLAAWVDGVLVDLPDAVGHPAFPRTLESLVAGNGGTTLDAARAALSSPGVLREFSVSRPRILPPLTLADDRAPDALAPGATLTVRPREELACRPELACIVGRGAAGRGAAQARGALFGYTVVIAWHLRRPDQEFVPIGTTVGPCVATADEIDATARVMVVTVDGHVIDQAALAPGITTRFARTIARQSAKATVRPGEMYGLSPFSELISIPLPRRKRSAKPELVVGVEVPGIGRLENRVALVSR
ncbi:MAG TPA: fumarylacetoacetate hydrolase family protein [Actinomycetota bacterium]